MPPSPKNRRETIDLDTAGATASLFCAVHCALMPLVVTLLPLLGLGFLASERMEWSLLALSALLGCFSLCFGYRTHRRGGALAVLATGLALLTTGHVAEEHGLGARGVVLVVLGGITVATSHLLNRRLCVACHVCEREERVEQLLRDAGHAYRHSPPE